MNFSLNSSLCYKHQNQISAWVPNHKIYATESCIKPLAVSMFVQVKSDYDEIYIAQKMSTVYFSNIFYCIFILKLFLNRVAKLLNSFKHESLGKIICLGQAVPRGLHIRLNLQTGEREAKLMDEDNSDVHGSYYMMQSKSRGLSDEFFGLVVEKLCFHFVHYLAVVISLENVVLNSNI